MSGQNTSSAVMQQRSEPADSFDYFPTPLWATRAICERINIDRGDVILEPACGEGYMSRALSEYSDDVRSYDIQDLGFGGRGDYLFPNDYSDCDWTISNPPFVLAEEFILKAIMHSRKGVAMFVRSAFIEGKGRFENLFSKVPPSHYFQFVERVALVKGRVDEHVSSATAYCWIVWEKDSDDKTELNWIAPCRSRLTKLGDYT